MQSNEVRSSVFDRRSKDDHETHLKFANENGASCCGVKKQCAFSKIFMFFLATPQMSCMTFLSLHCA